LREDALPADETIDDFDDFSRFALIGLLASGATSGVQDRAYEYADLMLERRKKQ
jgi:hypothetical protein